MLKLKLGVEVSLWWFVRFRPNWSDWVKIYACKMILVLTLESVDIGLARCAFKYRERSMYSMSKSGHPQRLFCRHPSRPSWLRPSVAEERANGGQPSPCTTRCGPTPQPKDVATESSGQSARFEGVATFGDLSSNIFNSSLIKLKTFNVNLLNV
jgi:hypothetical protein